MMRRRYVLRGVVQGVGFRPHVTRIAHMIGVHGFCGNDDESVFIEVQGSSAQLDEFIARVTGDAPPLAHITSITSENITPIESDITFMIVESEHAAEGLTLIPPDVARCEGCVVELRDPGDRRYGYPFISCTNCGPRLSVIRDLPYDRTLTSLDVFPMCDACEAEYTDPLNRRFHAEPISCFDCGPRLWLVENEVETAQWQSAIDRARELVAEGKIIAVKGLGGFTLMCDARNENAVALLRARKHRPGKPFAVMAADEQSASAVAYFDPSHVTALVSGARPIVLAPKNETYDLAPSVAPGLKDVGIMLPSAPVHDLLLQSGDVFVATSGNIAGDPLCYRNEDALRDLAQLVDALLINDREIVVPVEDSVVLTDEEGLLPIRRSRGFAPLPVNIPKQDKTVLAVGGELKNTFTLTRDGYAFVSAHIGDMGSLATQTAFDRSVAQMLAAHRRVPDLIVADLHPSYSTTAWAQRYAERHDIPLLQVQHHTAHALSLLAEHGLLDSTDTHIIVTFDGTGYASDGTIWGGEILGLTCGDAQRLWHLPEYYLPGGDSAVTNPWKSALGLLHALGIDPHGLLPWELAPENERILVESQLVNHVAVIPTTSAGRLFDALSSLIGIRQTVTYEAQAAMELEAIARDCDHSPLTTMPSDVSELVEQLIAGVKDGEHLCCLSRHIHRGLATVTADAIGNQVTAKIEMGEIAPSVGLTGGVFQNRIFTGDLVGALYSRGQIGRVLTHNRVPANDGGLSLGQAAAGVLLLGQKGDTSCA